MPRMWDIFCTVIDNYGDVGVCWRLARRLANEKGLKVRLWIDDMHAFAAINPDTRADAIRQTCDGVEIRLWPSVFPDIESADVVIEGFGCRLPENYLQAMARCPQRPVWINLEYLSAEAWASEYHTLPSPHPQLPLNKHFFFPGFGPGTGGLIRETALTTERTRFQFDPSAIAAYFAVLNIAPRADELRISIFCYENPVLPELLKAWGEGEQAVLCLVPEGRALSGIQSFFQRGTVAAGEQLDSGRLRVQILPLTSQAAYDRLLWACDLNFVRGEDSFVRAQLAARPLIWHIYPQEEEAHLTKLDAFLDRYCAGMSADAAASTQKLFAIWNGASTNTVSDAWRDWLNSRAELNAHAAEWAETLENGPELADELVKFAQAQVK